MQSANSNSEESGQSGRIEGDMISGGHGKTTEGVGRSYSEDSDNHQEERPNVATSRQEDSGRRSVKQATQQRRMAEVGTSARRLGCASL